MSANTDNSRQHLLEIFKEANLYFTAQGKRYIPKSMAETEERAAARKREEGLIHEIQPALLERLDNLKALVPGFDFYVTSSRSIHTNIRNSEGLPDNLNAYQCAQVPGYFGIHIVHEGRGMSSGLKVVPDNGQGDDTYGNDYPTFMNMVDRLTGQLIFLMRSRGMITPKDVEKLGVGPRIEQREMPNTTGGRAGMPADPPTPKYPDLNSAVLDCINYGNAQYDWALADVAQIYRGRVDRKELAGVFSEAMTACVDPELAVRARKILDSVLSGDGAYLRGPRVPSRFTPGGASDAQYKWDCLGINRVG